jgi:hypothetical protein
MAHNTPARIVLILIEPLKPVAVWSVTRFDG